MKFYRSLLLVLLTVAFGAYGQETEKFSLEVKDFSELKVSDGINVVYHNSTDMAGMAVYETTRLISSKITFSNNKSCLQIQLATDGVKYNNLPTLHVYSNVLTKVINDGDSTVTVNETCEMPMFKCSLGANGTIVVNNIKTDEINASITNIGKGNIVLTGSAAKASYSNKSGGTIDATGLDAKQVSVNIYGPGNVNCVATESLSVLGGGSGKVYFKGQPAKIKNRTLGVKTFSLDN